MIAEILRRPLRYAVDLLRKNIMDRMDIRFRELTNYRFLHKPLIIGDAAMQFFGLKSAGKIDILLDSDDFRILSNYVFLDKQGNPRPERMKYFIFDPIWWTQSFYTRGFRFHNSYKGNVYEDFTYRSEEMGTYCVVSLPMLHEMKSMLDHSQEKLDDLELILEQRTERDSLFHSSRTWPEINTKKSRRVW